MIPEEKFVNYCFLMIYSSLEKSRTHQNMVTLVDDLLAQFEDSLSNLLLNESQEKALLATLNSAMESMTAVYATSSDIDKSIRYVLNELEMLDKEHNHKVS